MADDIRAAPAATGHIHDLEMLLSQKRLNKESCLRQAHNFVRLTGRLLHGLTMTLFAFIFAGGVVPQPVHADTLQRACEIEGALTCPQGERCDMLRNRCTPVCEGDDCCREVRCPPGSECVNSDGRCGTPVNGQCYDMGTTWWTGRDRPPEQKPLSSPVPVKIEVINNTSQALHFTTLQGQPVRFDIYQLEQGSERKLELAVNHYCVNRCPTQGPAFIRDCEPPRYETKHLPPKARISLMWSGQEEVGMQRVCEKHTPQFCMVSRITQPGSYAVEVCADNNKATQAEQRLNAHQDKMLCRRAQFNHPATNNISIQFDD